MLAFICVILMITENMISKSTTSIYGDREALILVGKRLRALRLQKNQTQAKAAKLAGISIPTYQKLESGDGTVKVGVFARVLAMRRFADRLGNIIPEPEPPVDMKALLKPARQRARGRES